LPASAFAAQRAKKSIAPPCGTPDEREYFRPRSWIARYGGARVIVIK
jgi:hypothetical protein